MRKQSGVSSGSGLVRRESEEGESGTSVRNMQPGEWLKAKEGSGRQETCSSDHKIRVCFYSYGTRSSNCSLLLRMASIAVTPQAQNTGTSPG